MEMEMGRAERKQAVCTRHTTNQKKSTSRLQRAGCVCVSVSLVLWVEAASRNQKNKTGDAAVDLDTAEKTQSENHTVVAQSTPAKQHRRGDVLGGLGGERPNRVRRIGSQGGAHPPCVPSTTVQYCTYL